MNRKGSYFYRKQCNIKWHVTIPNKIRVCRFKVKNSYPWLTVLFGDLEMDVWKKNAWHAVLGDHVVTAAESGDNEDGDSKEPELDPSDGGNDSETVLYNRQAMVLLSVEQSQSRAVLCYTVSTTNQCLYTHNKDYYHWTEEAMWSQDSGRLKN